MYSSKSKLAFTLMEVIVSVSIIALIFTLTASFLWLNFKISTRAKSISQDYYGTRNLFELIADDISSASGFKYDGCADLVIEGGGSISFWYVKPDLMDRGIYSKPILRISYYMEDSDGERVLFKRLEDPFSDYSEEYIVYAAEFKFIALNYDESDKSLVKLEDYSEDSFPRAVAIESNIEGEPIEKRVFLLQGSRI
jgi:hypothetical protein